MPEVLIACPFAEDLVAARIDAASVDELDEENVLVTVVNVDRTTNGLGRP